MITANIILLLVILFVSTIASIRLIKSRDGLLRVIMIFLFFAEAWASLCFLAVEFAIGNSMLIETQYTLFIAFIPLFISDLLFYNFLIKQK